MEIGWRTLPELEITELPSSTARRIVGMASKSRGHVFIDDDGFKVMTNDRLFSWADCWPSTSIDSNGLASLDPWLATVIFGSMYACDQFMETFARILQLPEPIAPGLMVFSRTPTDAALHELKRIYDETRKTGDSGTC